MTSMMTNRTKRSLRQSGTTAAVWHRSALSLGVTNCLSSLYQDTFMVGAHQQGQPRAIEGSAIKDRYLKI